MVIKNAASGGRDSRRKIIHYEKGWYARVITCPWTSQSVNSKVRREQDLGKLFVMYGT